MTDYSNLTAPEINVANQVLSRFLEGGLNVHSMSAVEGGFSGAGVIRICTSTGEYALRRWPLNSQRTFPAERIRELHRFLRDLSSAGIPVAVPVQLRNSPDTVLLHRNIFWQCEPWRPGKPFTGESLGPVQLQSAMEQLARLHLAASRYQCSAAGGEWFASGAGGCPAVQERRTIIASTTPETIVNYRAHISTAPEAFRAIAVEILGHYVRHVQRIDNELQQLEDIPVPVHPCWRDLWYDHVLFSGERVSGFIDPTATRTDHVSTDLSRLLGSWFQDDKRRWQTALSCYAAIRPLSEVEVRLIHALDRSSVLLSGLTWLERWSRRDIENEHLPRVLERLQINLNRLSHGCSNL